MKNLKNIIIIAILFLILLGTNLFMFYKILDLKKDFKTYENTIGALNDSLTVTINNGIATWQKQTPEIDLKKLLDSEYFKTLSEEQQQYYNELKKIRGLIASTKSELEKQAYILEELNTDHMASINADSITFGRGDTLHFAEVDTTKNLQWKSNIVLDSITQFAFDYNYKVDITTNFVRNKDKSIMVQYHINDPDLTMNKNYSFIIPQEDRNGFQKFMDKHGRWAKPVGYGIIGAGLVGGGIYIGTKITK